LSGRRTGMGAVVEGVRDVVRTRCRCEDDRDNRSHKERPHKAPGVAPILFHLLREGSHIGGFDTRRRRLHTAVPTVEPGDTIPR
jgi:hypothetical protein